MPDEKKQVRLTFDFVMPVERIMAVARDHLDSPDGNYRSVAMAVLDVTAVATTIQKEIAADGNVDLAPYFDFWFGDAVDCAHKLLHYSDSDARDLGQCLIDMEKAAIKSKENFLTEMKRLGIRPGG
jgi:hypothetical protein